jgi:hypothetical protein
MKVRIIFILGILVFILIPITNAQETEVTIHTLPNHEALIRILHPDYDSLYVLDNFKYISNTNGNIVFTFESSRQTFDIGIVLSKNGEKVGDKRFEGTFTSGYPVEVEYYPGEEDDSSNVPVAETSNETNETQTNVTETSSEVNQTNETLETLSETTEQETTPIEEVRAEKEKVTAFSIHDRRISIAPKGFLYILGLVVLIILIFVGIKNSHHIEKKLKEGKGSNKKEIKIKKMSDLNKKKSERLKDQEEKIEKAKKMIEEAQEEINKMKNPNQAKIDEVKKRLIEDEKELIRLRRESGHID